MAFNAKVGSFNTGTGTSDIVVSGLGFQPKFVIFHWSGRTESSDTVGASSIYSGWGFAVSTTDRRAVSQAAELSAATSNGATVHSNTACIITTTPSGAADGTFDLKSMDTGGFTLSVSDANSIDLRVMYIAVGGTDITNVKGGMDTSNSTTGNKSVTGVGFQPDILFFIASMRSVTTPPDYQNSHAGMSFGVAMSSSKQYTWAGGMDDAVADMDTGAYIYSGEFLATTGSSNPLTISDRKALVSMDTDGFTFNQLDLPQTGAPYFHYLAIKGGNWDIGDLLTQTDTTTEVTETLSFQPALLMFTSANRAQSTQDAGTAHNSLSFGAATSTTERIAQAHFDENLTADGQSATAIEYDAVYANISSADAIQGLGDVSSITSSSFKFIMDDADPAQSFVFWVAGGGTGSATQTVTLTSGIASAEAFGTTTVNRGAVSVSPSGIASAEAFGTHTINRGPVSVSPTGISTGEVFGTPTINRGAVTISTTGIPSAEAVGSFEKTDDFNRASLGSNWTIIEGTPSISSNQLTAPAEAKLRWDADTFADNQFSEAAQYGTGWRGVTVRSNGLYSYVAWISNVGGTYTLRLGWQFDGGWGAYLDTGVSVTVNSGDILRLEVSGQDDSIVLKAYISGVLKSTLRKADFSNQAAVLNSGKPGLYFNSGTQIQDNWRGGTLGIQINLDVSPAGISSVEAFGTPTINRGAVSISPTGIASAEAFGTATVSTGSATISPTSISTAEAFGTTTVTTGAVTITTTGIPSAEAFGAATLNRGVVSVSPTGIPTAEAFGSYIVYTSSFARPDSDVAAGNWTDQNGGTANLYSVIDEVAPDDNDYIKLAVTVSSQPVELGLQNPTDPQVGYGHKVRYRYRKQGGETVNFTFTLKQGVTTIATWSQNNVSDTWVTSEYSLSEAEANSISDYANLRIVVDAVKV